jgi:hypothetical protein
MKTLCGMAIVGLVLLSTVASSAGEDGTTLLSKCSVAIQLEDPGRRRQATPQEAYDNGYCQGSSRGSLTAAIISPLPRRTGIVSCLAASFRARPSG